MKTPQAPGLRGFMCKGTKNSGKNLFLPEFFILPIRLFLPTA